MSIASLLTSAPVATWTDLRCHSLETDILDVKSLLIEGDAEVKGNLTVDQGTDLKGTLTVALPTNLNGILTVSNDVFMQGSLDVVDIEAGGIVTTQDVTIGGNLDAGGYFSAPAQPAAAWSQTGAQTIPSGIETAVAFDTLSFTQGGSRAPTRTGSTFKVNFPGLYLITASASMENEGKAGDRNNFLLIAGQNNSPGAAVVQTFGSFFTSTVVRRLGPDDPITFYVYQDSGFSLDMLVPGGLITIVLLS